MMSVREATGRTFRSLSVRNYRLYFAGQVVSVSGTWMQQVAQAWLVLRLTNSGVALGTVTALQFLPVLLGGAWGGVIADRFDKRRVLFGTQATAGLLALVLGLLTLSGDIQLWMVYVLAAALGCVNAVDNPSRQAFVHEMVGRADLPNAVSLNSVLMNAARVIGPALAAVLIVTVGLAPCFLINAASYAAVIIGLAMMRREDLLGTGTVARAKGQLRAGLHYAWSTPELRNPLLLMVVIGTLAYEFQVTLPLMARFTFHGGAGAYGLMTSSMAAGAVVGGLAVASRERPTSKGLTRAALAFGLLILGVAAAPSLAIEVAILVLMGAASIAFIAMSNSTLQLRSDPAMRGRVMALFAVAFLGSTPIGAPVVGAVAQAWGPRASIAIGGVAALVAAVVTAGRPLRAIVSRSEAHARGQQSDNGQRQQDPGRGTETGESGGQADDGEGPDRQLGGVANEEVPPEPAEGHDGPTDGHGSSAGSPSRPPGPATGRRDRRNESMSQKVTAP
jgi:MFS family permease